MSDAQRVEAAGFASAAEWADSLPAVVRAAVLAQAVARLTDDQIWQLGMDLSVQYLPMRERSAVKRREDARKVADERRAALLTALRGAAPEARQPGGDSR